MTWRSESILRWGLYAAGIFAGFFFVLTKNEQALSWAMAGSYAYGDLYRYAKVARFKPAAPLLTSSELDSLTTHVPRLETSTSFFCGDSFGITSFRDDLALRTHQVFFSVGSKEHPEVHESPCSLLEERLQKDLPPAEIVVFEMAERLIPGYFSSDNCLRLVADTPMVSKQSGCFNAAKRALLVDTELHHKALLRHGWMWASLMKGWNTLLFESTGALAPELPLHANNPPFLFYRGEVDIFRTNYSDAEIGAFAERLAALQGLIKARFHSDFLFIPVPSKISVYSRLATAEPYNELLPRLCVALRRRGVKSVELLDLFRKENDLLYWPTDTHWNQRGMQIAVDEVVRVWPLGTDSVGGPEGRPATAVGAAKSQTR